MKPGKETVYIYTPETGFTTDIQVATVSIILLCSCTHFANTLYRGLVMFACVNTSEMTLY